MSEHDDRVSNRYRALGRDEPPPSVDAAILKRARSAGAPPRHAWLRGLSAAAVVVLALGITVRMQLEEPGIDTSAPAAGSTATRSPRIEPPASESTPASPIQHAAPPASAVSKDASHPANPIARRPQGQAAGPAIREMRDAAPHAERQAPTQERARAAKNVGQDALQAALERIAALRASGRDGEADAALAQFRELHPDYRIDPAMWDRIKPR